jgi:hypothetical protein
MLRWGGEFLSHGGEEDMDLETALYAFAWIAGFVIFLVRFGKLYR